MKKSMFLILASVLLMQSCYGNFIVHNKSDKYIQLCGINTPRHDGLDVCVYHLIPGDSVQIDPTDINGISALIFQKINENFMYYRNFIMSERHIVGPNKKLVNLGDCYLPQMRQGFFFTKEYSRKAAQYPITIDITYDDSTKELVFNMPKDEKELHQAIEKLQLKDQIKDNIPQLANTPGIADIITGYVGTVPSPTENHGCCTIL